MIDSLFNKDLILSRIEMLRHQEEATTKEYKRVVDALRELHDERKALEEILRIYMEKSE